MTVLFLNIQIRNKEPPLPKPFKLPVNYPQNVQKAVKKDAARKMCNTTIAHAVYLCKSYPIKEEYLHVVQHIYKKWPFLQDGRGLVS